MKGTDWGDLAVIQGLRRQVFGGSWGGLDGHVMSLLNRYS